jgi:2-methylisocitrate lyase-like PEP mutase family enzyme
MHPQAAALKALLDEPRLQVMPGCGDGMGARLIEEAGFRTGFVSGSSVSAMRLAMPDMDLVSFTEMADAAEGCCPAPCRKVEQRFPTTVKTAIGRPPEPARI